MEQQQIKQRAFAAYIGADVVDTIHPIGIHKTYGIVNNDIWVNGDDGYDYISIDECQLSLTPLSDITDEDAIEVARIINSHEPHSPCLQLDVSMVKAGYLIDDIRNSSLWNYDVTDYLRSKKYCIPFMGLDLVKEGWAVLKTKSDE